MMNRVALPGVAAIVLIAIVALILANVPILPIPATGLQNAPLTCTGAETTITPRLPNGDQVRLPCGIGDLAILDAVPEETLPLSIAPGSRYISGLAINVLQNNTALNGQSPGKNATASFVVPATLANRTLVILYWNLALNGGSGGWVEVPTTISRGRAEATVNYVGAFVLTAR